MELAAYFPKTFVFFIILLFLPVHYNHILNPCVLCKYNKPGSHLHSAGSLIPTRQPHHLRGPDPHDPDLQQPEPPRWGPLCEHPLWAGQWAGHGPHEGRRPCRTVGPPTQGPPGTEEDQSWKPIGSPAGGALPHSSWPRLCHDCTQRGQNLQVGHRAAPTASEVTASQRKRRLLLVQRINVYLAETRLVWFSCARHQWDIIHCSVGFKSRESHYLNHQTSSCHT